MGISGEEHDLVGRLRNERVKALAEIFDGLRPRLWRIVDLRLDRRLHGRVDVASISSGPNRRMACTKMR